jgi:hypothetical protein
MTVIYEFEGWVITDTHIITHGCMKRRAKQTEPKNYPINKVCEYYCPSCQTWMPSHVSTKLFKIRKFIAPV